jgi:hypothetical protein
MQILGVISGRVTVAYPGLERVDVELVPGGF